MTTNTPRSAFARRVALYELAALPASHVVVPGADLRADECYGYALDRLAVRDSAEARRVEDVLRAAEVA